MYHEAVEPRDDTREYPVVDVVDHLTGRRPRSVIEDGRCVVAANPNEREPYKILDSGTFNRVMQSLVVRGD